MSYFVGYAFARLPNKKDDFLDRCPVTGEVLPPKSEEWVILDDHFRQLSQAGLEKVPDRVITLRDTLNRRVGNAYLKWPMPVVATSIEPYNHFCSEKCNVAPNIFSYRGVKYAIGYPKRGTIGPSRLHVLCDRHAAEEFPLLDVAVRELYSYPAYEPPVVVPYVPTPEEVAEAKRCERIDHLLRLKHEPFQRELVNADQVLKLIREIALEVVQEAGAK